MIANYNSPFANSGVNKPFQIQEKAADKQSVEFITANDTDGDDVLSKEELTAAGGFLGQQAMTPEETERLKLLFASVAGSNGLSAMELTQARLVMDNTIQGGDGQITAQEQETFYQNLANNIKSEKGLAKGSELNYSNLFQFGEGAGVHAKLAPSAIEKQDAVQYVVAANEDQLNTLELNDKHKQIVNYFLAALSNLNGGLSGELLQSLKTQLEQGLKRTANLEDQKPDGLLRNILPISPSQGF